MFSHLATKRTRNSLVIFTVSFHNTIKKSSTFIPDTTKFPSPPSPKKSNKVIKGKTKLTKQGSGETETKTEQATITKITGNTTTKQGVRVISPPKLTPESSFKFDDKKRFKNELKLKRFEYGLESGLVVSKNKEQQRQQQSIIDERSQKSEEELELIQRKKGWYEKIKQERQEKLDKINETIKVLSLSSKLNADKLIEYKEIKRKNALKIYHKRESEKRKERRLNLLTLYYNSSDFVTLNNLDSKITEMYNEERQPFATSLEDMQIEYLGGGGIIDDLELKRRLDKIKDTLNDTAQGGNQKLGLNKIEKLYAKKLKESEVSKSADVPPYESEQLSVHPNSTGEINANIVIKEEEKASQEPNL